MTFSNIEPRDTTPPKATLSLLEAEGVLQDFINGVHVQTSYRNRNLPKHPVIKFYDDLREIQELADQLMMINVEIPITKLTLKQMIASQTNLPNSLLTIAINARISAATATGTFSAYKKAFKMLFSEKNL